jgi:uncharacterized repeat protein (TIGR01451 family)
MSARSRIWGFVAWLMFLAAREVYPAVIEVTNVNDSGPGSLRDAIARSNANPGTDEVIIMLPADGPQTIKPLSPLPDIFDPCSIDVQGTTKVELDGSMAGTNAIGLRFLPTSQLFFTIELSAVNNLVINNFDGAGILSDGQLIVSNCCIGTDVTGTQARPNADGIYIEDVDFAALRDSVVSGNINGIVMHDSSNITIENCKIGTNAAGNAGLGNTNDGVRAQNSSNIRVVNSTVSGNVADGIELRDTNSSIIENCRIGTNATGDTAIENTDAGILVANSSYNILRNNVISGNRGGLTAGIYIVGFGGVRAEHNQLYDNIVGLNTGGNAALPNLFTGVGIFNGSDNIIGPGNIISGNGEDGVRIGGVFGIGNVVTGNRIGTDVTGMVDLGNGRDGVRIDQGATKNTIGFRIAENDSPAPRERFSFSYSYFEAGGNLIAGNKDEGVEISTIVVNQLPGQNVVQGNLIGVNLTGNSALPNASHGLQIGSTLSSAGTSGNIVRLNVIAGNPGAGIFVGRNASDNDFIDNFIGIGSTSTIVIGNGSHGIFIDGGADGNSGNEIRGNMIASNAGDGVFIQNSVRSKVSGNYIFSNNGLGIDLAPDGVTANDAGDGDTGANNLQNFPIITSTNTVGGVTTVEGMINSAAGVPVFIELYVNTTCDPSGSGEGQFPSTSFLATPDGSGHANFSVTINSPAPIPAGLFVTATATDPDGNTSEFSPCHQITGDPTSAEVSVTKTAEPHIVEPGENITYTIIVRNNGPAPANTLRLTDATVGTTFQSLTAPGGWTCNTPAPGANESVSCETPLLAPGAEVTFTLVVKANSDLPGEIFIANLALLSSATPDPNPANNSAPAVSWTPRTPPVLLGNISTRLPVGAGDNALIAGFIVTGTQDKRVILRGIGPSLPLSGALLNPRLDLYNSSGTVIASNDDWRDSQQVEIEATGIPPTNDNESAIVATLPANNSAYTVILRGVNDATGIGVVEVYDLNASVNSTLANISTRGFVQTGDSILIAGTIVVGDAPQKVIARAIGPSLSIPGKLADPMLELRDANGGLLEANDNWIDSPNMQAIIDSSIPPANDLESAVVRMLAPANYTAIVRGVNDSTGIAVVEVYALP